MRNRKLNPAIWGGLAVILLLSGLFWWLNRVLHTPAPYPGSGAVEIVIEKGTTLHQVAEMLAQKRLIDDIERFRWAAWITGAEKKIQPGRFLVSYGATNSQILSSLMRPGIKTRDVTIPEGLTVKQIASILARELEIDSAKFVKLCEDPAFARKLGVPAGRLEGYLFPETYNFYWESSPRDLITRMVHQFFVVFNDSLKQKLDKVGLNLHQAVTLASIIQGEVMLTEEAPFVSAVYHNRLKKRIPLAADPTVQYLLPDGPRRLFKRDLEIDSPYNTYKHLGLPPGPVNNPGRMALGAAVEPAGVDYLYFVARGDGSHAFNQTHDGHLRDKQKLQQVRRELERNGNHSKTKSEG